MYLLIKASCKCCNRVLQSRDAPARSACTQQKKAHSPLTSCHHLYSNLNSHFLQHSHGRATSRPSTAPAGTLAPCTATHSCGPAGTPCLHMRSPRLAARAIRRSRCRSRVASPQLCRHHNNNISTCLSEHTHQQHSSCERGCYYASHTLRRTVRGTRAASRRSAAAPPALRASSTVTFL